MANEDANPVFDADERPTRPGIPARTATSRWRAVSSVALQRGIGRLSDGEFDEGNLDAATDEPSPVAPAEPLPDPVDPPSEPPVEVSRSVWALGPRGTVRIPFRGDRGPTGTVRIPKRTTHGARAATAPPRRSRWWALGAFAVVACVQLGFLAASAPDPPVAPSTTPDEPVVARPAPGQTSQPLIEPAVEEVDPPVPVATSIATSPTPTKPPAKLHARKATHAASSVL